METLIVNCKPSKVCRPNGFTLIEILVTLAIVGVVATFATIMSMDTFAGHNARAERDLVVSLLERARSQAMNNINQSPHGLHIDGGSYNLFQGTDWKHRATDFDADFPGASAVQATGSDVVFNQLSGSPLATDTIIISGENRQFTISINSEGQINW